ncbi:MAG: PAS domain S-box protein [Chlorobiaceae bacterium]|nr:PAS domain S-box protein [Chlorobiaceae bacterium]
MKKGHYNIHSGQAEDPAEASAAGYYQRVNHLEKILDKMVDAFVYCHVIYQDGRASDLMHEEINEAYRKLTGLNDVVGRRLTEVMPGIAESNPEFFGRLLKVADSGIPDKFDIHLEELGKWFSNTVYCPEKGTLVAIFNDVTEKKRTELIIKNNKEQFKAIIKAANVGTWDWDIPSGRVIFNERWFDIVGYCREELEPVSIQTWIDLVHPEDLKESTRQLQQHFNGESEDYTMECRMRHKNGQWIWVLTSGKVLERTPEGKPVRMLGTHYDITRHKKAEEELKKSEARFRTLFNSASSIQVLIDPDTGRILDANQTAVNWYGWPIDEMKRMSAGDVNMMAPEAVIDSLAKVSAGQHNIFAGRHRLADGSVRDVEVYRNLVEIDGKPVVHVIIHDITERKSAENALIESEERFRNMFEGHSAIMIVVDPDTGNIVDANEASATFYGWSVNELRRMHISAINIESREFIQRELQKWEHLNQRSMTFRHRRADGSIRDVEIFAKKIRLKGKELIYDIVHDVTSRKRMEMVNRYRIRLLNIADKYPPVNLLQKTLDQAEKVTGSTVGFCHFVNDDQESLTQQAWSTNTLLNMCSADGAGLHYSLDKAGVWADAARLKKPVIHNDYASLSDRKGMPEGHAEVKREMVIPIIRDKKVVAVLGLGNKPTDYDSEDVDLVVLLANQIWDIIAKKIVDENQKQLQTQLEHAKKMEMVGQLAAGITHEINNPLNFLVLNNEMLKCHFTDISDLIASFRRTVVNAEAFPELADEVHQLMNKEKELDIDMLLDDTPNILEDQKRGLQRISAITQSMRGYSFKNPLNSIIASDFSRLVNEVVAIVKTESIYDADIDLKLENIPMVQCNPSQINQVLLNLILNSVHAIKSEKRNTRGKVTVKTWSADGQVFCSVKDDGPGVAEENREKIFSPFFTTREPGQGTGLGLSISYDIIVNKHNGKIVLDCPQDGGAVFTFSLPINP